MSDGGYGVWSQASSAEQEQHGDDDDDDDDDGRVDLAVLTILICIHPFRLRKEEEGRHLVRDTKEERERERTCYCSASVLCRSPEVLQCSHFWGKEGVDTAWMEWYWRADRIYNPTEQELIPWLSLPLYHGAAC